MSASPSQTPVDVLAFGAHPDDVEFGAGGIVAGEVLAGRSVRLVVGSRGEAATHGTPQTRADEAARAAAALGAGLEFLDLGGDAHFEVSVAHTLVLAAAIRRWRPRLVLAPTVVENQHPDHARLGRMVRDAARLARYGGVAELRPQPAHAVDQLLHYAVTPGAEPGEAGRILVDISAPEIMARWRAALEAHASQARTRDYGELQLTRARLHGLQAGVGHAQPLWPADSPVFASLEPLRGAARRF